jgi:hypothetical protein
MKDLLATLLLSGTSGDPEISGVWPDTDRIAKCQNRGGNSRNSSSFNSHKLPVIHLINGTTPMGMTGLLDSTLQS